MGKTDRFVERTFKPPAGVMRVFCLVAPILMTVQAVGSLRLEDILTAVWFGALLLPSGVAPKAYRARLAALDDRPIVSAVFMLLMMGCGCFVLLTDFLERATSALIAVPLSMMLTAVGILLRRRARTPVNQ